MKVLCAARRRDNRGEPTDWWCYSESCPIRWSWLSRAATTSCSIQIRLLEWSSSKTCETRKYSTSCLTLEVANTSHWPIILSCVFALLNDHNELTVLQQLEPIWTYLRWAFDNVLFGRIVFPAGHCENDKGCNYRCHVNATCSLKN